MARYIDVEGYRKLFDEEYKKTRKLIFEGETHLDNLAEGFSEASRVIDRMPTADVVPRAEVFEEVDKFRADLMNKFIDLCRGNDYNKLTLLKIGDVVDEMYDRRIAEFKMKYTEGQK